MSGNRLFIGKVAAQTAMNPKTIRYYEQIGLLPTPERTESRYRLYTSEMVELLKFIRKAQGLGLQLSEIREIASIRRQGNPPCVHVRTLIKERVADLDRKLGDLQMLRDRLQVLLRNWTTQAHRGETSICPHIETAPLLQRQRDKHDTAAVVQHKRRLATPSSA